MRDADQKRYWLLGLLFLISIIPQVIMLPLLGSINLLFLIVVWVILWAFIFLAPKPVAVVIAILAAIAMAIPPSPNYEFPTNTGALHFQFIGWDNVANALYGVVFFFVFYLILFELAALFVRRPPKVADPATE